MPAGDDTEDGAPSPGNGVQPKSKTRLETRRLTLSSIHEISSEISEGVKEKSEILPDRETSNAGLYLKENSKKKMPRALLKKNSKLKKDKEMYQSMPSLNSGDVSNSDKSNKLKKNPRKLKKTLTKEDISSPSNFQKGLYDIAGRVIQSAASTEQLTSNALMDETFKDDEDSGLETFLQSCRVSKTSDLPRRVSLPAVPVPRSLRDTYGSVPSLARLDPSRTLRVHLPNGNVEEVSGETLDLLE